MHTSQSGQNLAPGLSVLKPQGLFRDLGAAFLLWCGLATTLFIVYAGIEAIWLRDLTPQLTNIAHLLRGLVISLVTAMATAVFLMRRVVPTLGSSLEAGAGTDGLRSTGAPEGLARWLVGMRWLAIIALFAVVGFVTLQLRPLPSGTAVALWSAVALLAVWNLSLGSLPPRRLASPAALSSQIAVDVAILGWLVHNAGGMTNPFAGFFVFHAIVAGIVLHGAHARRVVAAIAACVLSLTALEATGALAPVCLPGVPGACDSSSGWLHLGAAGLGVTVMVVVCALIVVTLVQTLHSERDRLAIARTEVLEEREKLQSIIDCMADAVVFVGLNRSLHLRNRASNQLWAGSTHDVKACHSQGAWEQLLDKLDTPGPSEMHPVFTVGGRSFEATYARVSDGQGRRSGVVMVARDITERIQTQKLQMDQERMAVVGKLAAGLAHEINNPLGAMVLFAQHALKAVCATDPLADHLRTVLRNASLCKKIVKDLLEYARQRLPERIDLEIEDLLGDVTRTLQPRAEQSGVGIRSALGSEVSGLHGDPDQLRQVLVNLGLNSIEAMPEGGTLEISAMARARGTLAIEVKDTGNGIAPEDRDKVFSAFFTTKPGGTGLGLAVARDLVAAHGGSLEFSSEPGRGSTFTVLLPVTVHDREATL